MCKLHGRTLHIPLSHIGLNGRFRRNGLITGNVVYSLRYSCMPQASSIHILSTCTTSDPQAKPTQHPGPAIAPVGTPQAGPNHANYRAPRDRTRHHIRRERRAAAQRDRIGANATIAPKIAAWRHPQRIHRPRTAPQPRATLTTATDSYQIAIPDSLSLSELSAAI